MGEKGRKNLVKYIESGKLEEDLILSRLRQSRMVILLAEIACRKARPDGWTLLSIAGSFFIPHSVPDVSPVTPPKSGA